LAEIHYKRREYQEAIRLIRQAITQAPQAKYYKRQLAKFQRAAKRRLSGG
jgi:tetratricopeptide (TPR) repeat protein